MNVRLYVCVYVYMCMYIFVCMYVCMSVCMFVCLFGPSRFASRSVSVFDRMLLKRMRVLGFKKEEVAEGWGK